MVISNQPMNQKSNEREFSRREDNYQFHLFRIIPNIVKNAANDLSKSVLASLVFLKEDQPDEDSR